MAAPQAVVPAPSQTHRSRDGVGGARRGTFWALLLPVVGFLAVFLVLPLIMMAALSTRTDLSGPLLEPWTPTLETLRISGRDAKSTCGSC